MARHQRGRGKNRSWCRAQYGTDSKFEADLRGSVLSDCVFQGDKIQYSIPHNYTPDFTTPDGKVQLELKGRFVEMSEATKYIHIREALPEGVELVFVFYKRGQTLPNAKVRKKCGTKRTNEEWCESHSFSYYYRDTIGDFLKERGYERNSEGE